VATRRRWVLIAVGVVILIVFIGIGAIFAITVWFQQNLQVETRSAGAAEQEFAGVRKQYEGRAPLLEMRDGRPQFTAEHDRPAAGTPSRLETLHVLAWNAKEERLARFSLPFWLIRMKSEPFRVSAYMSGLDDRVAVRAEDIERYGPGIILDINPPSGDRVLLWAR
jgi:hypothetical protein